MNCSVMKRMLDNILLLGLDLCQNSKYAMTNRIDFTNEIKNVCQYFNKVQVWNNYMSGNNISF